MKAPSLVQTQHRPRIGRINCFAIIIGAEIFSNFITFAGLPDHLYDVVDNLGLGPWEVIIVIVLIYMALGAVLESLSMILLTVPIFYPLVSQLDFGTGLLGDPNNILIWFAVIVGIDDQELGLVVDHLIGEEDIVIKSMAENYRNVEGIAGASILGDGRVSLILDVGALLELSERKAANANGSKATIQSENRQACLRKENGKIV